MISSRGKAIECLNLNNRPLSGYRFRDQTVRYRSNLGRSSKTQRMTALRPFLQFAAAVYDEIGHQTVINRDHRSVRVSG